MVDTTPYAMTLPGHGVRALLNGTKTLHVVPHEVTVRNQSGCPYGDAGSRLWIRESWNPDPVDRRVTVYRATESVRATYGWRWCAPSAMPRSRSRLMLETTGVEFRPVQSITNAEIAACGFSGWTKDGALYKYGPSCPGDDADAWYWVDMPRTPRDAFVKLWDELNDPAYARWESNPSAWFMSIKIVTPTTHQA